MRHELNRACKSPHRVPGHHMGGLVAHDCSNLILGLQELQKARVEHHLASRSHKGIHIARLIDDCKLPLQILRMRSSILSGNPCQEARANSFTYPVPRNNTLITSTTQRQIAGTPLR